jgi:hypothetical protein
VAEWYSENLLRLEIHAMCVIGYRKCSIIFLFAQQYFRMLISSGISIQQLSFEAVSMSCHTGKIQIQTLLEFDGGGDRLVCFEWILMVAINGSTKLREDLCSGCSADKSPVIFQEQPHHLICSSTTDMLTNDPNMITINVGPKHEWPKGGLSVSSSFAIPCSNRIQEIQPIALPSVLHPEFHWKCLPDFWIETFWGCYQRIVRSAMRLNMRPPSPAEAVAETSPLLMMPVFVMSLPHRVDRRRHMEALLPALGFRPPVFPRVITAADIDIEGLIRAGRVSRAAVDAVTARRDKGAAAIAAYVAHALSVLDVLRDAVAAGLDWFLVAEDDLMPAASLEEVRPPARLLIPRRRAMAEARQDGWET